MNIEQQHTPPEKKEWIPPQLVVLDVASDTRGGYGATSPADVGNYS